MLTTAEPRYLPPECDVSLRDGWFWQEGEEPKSLPHLLAIHEPDSRRGPKDSEEFEAVRDYRELLPQ